MNDKELDRIRASTDRANEARLHRSPRWAKICLVVAALLMGAGIVRPFLVSEESPKPVRTTGIDAPGAHSLAGDTDTATAAESPDSSSARKQSAMFRLGFSFAAAFAAAYAMRKFFNFTLASLGMFLAILFGLQFAGIIEVKWVAFQGDHDGIAAWMKSQFDSFQAFIKGALPSGAAAAAGLFAGWRRKG